MKNIINIARLLVLSGILALSASTGSAGIIVNDLSQPSPCSESTKVSDWKGIVSSIIGIIVNDFGGIIVNDGAETGQTNCGIIVND